jgi:flagellin
MAFQVSTNVSALNVYNNLGVQQTKAAASLAKISSGLKAAGGGDVASQGTAAALSAHAQLTQANISKVQTAVNALQAADTALGELVALGQKGLDVAGGFTAAGADTSAMEAQLGSLVLGITSVMTATFNGAALTAAAATLPVGGTAFAGSPTFAAVPTASNAAGGLAAFTVYVGAAVDARATNAANLATVQSSLQVLNAVAANEMAGVSQAQDTDIAMEMMNLTAANIMTEAATAMLAQSMQLPNAVLRLIQ